MIYYDITLIILSLTALALIIYVKLDKKHFKDKTRN
jgi:hypothetical protein